MKGGPSQEQRASSMGRVLEGNRSCMKEDITVGLLGCKAVTLDEPSDFEKLSGSAHKGRHSGPWWQGGGLQKQSTQGTCMCMQVTVGL